MKIEVRPVQSGKDLDAIYEIRQKVFVEEQKVDRDIEYDEFEKTSKHFIAFSDGTCVGTARWRRTPNGIKLERFAVLGEHRGQGIGSALVRGILDDLPPGIPVYLHSQLTATSLYERFGFRPEGDQFEEAGIQHYKMILKS